MAELQQFIFVSGEKKNFEDVLTATKTFWRRKVHAGTQFDVSIQKSGEILPKTFYRP